MLKRFPPSVILILFYFFLSKSTIAQQDSLGNLIKKFDNFWNYHYPEKIFLHTSQTFFLTGETVWFNVFIVDGFFHRPMDLSKVVYLELIDKENDSVLKTKIEVSKGHGDGTLFIPSSLSSGKYTLVAYTRWMRNFSSDLYFHTTITIANPFVPTGVDIKAKPPLYDIQFFPEGGNLVSGLTNTVAFRVVDENGKGINFNGAIVNDNNDTIMRLSPRKFGLGRFQLKPEYGQQYSLAFVDSHQQKIQTPIPSAIDYGSTLHLTDSADSIKVEVESKFLGKSPNLWFSLFVQSRQVRIASLSNVPYNGKTIFFLDKKKLTDGINHITLFNSNNQPVCERLYFKTPTHNLKIESNSNLDDYATREKIELNLTTKKSDGQPVSPLMSISVCRIDSLEQDEMINISNYFWLTSELKGNIESPEYYLTGNPDKEAVDNLMLTHGWSRFKWEVILTNQRPRIEFIPEYGGHLITGTVFNQSGVPSAAVNTYFTVIGKNAQLYLSRSDERGRVIYDVGSFKGKHSIVVQSNPEIDSTLKITLDDGYTHERSKISTPNFTLSEKNSNNLIDRNLTMQIQHSFDKRNHNNNLITTDSLPFYGLANEFYKLDDFTRFPTMEEVFREYIKGIMVRKRKDRFHFLTLDKANNALFRNNPLVLLDGVPIFNLNKLMAYDPRKVEKIDVMNRQYYLGHLTFDGLVNCSTYKGNLLDFTPDFASVIALEGLQPKKEFFSPQYEIKSQKENRVPDRRNLLFWSTDVRTDNQGKSHMLFYSSDLPGIYRISIQAISEDGEFGSSTSIFRVRK